MGTSSARILRDLHEIEFSNLLHRWKPTSWLREEHDKCFLCKVNPLTPCRNFGIESAVVNRSFVPARLSSSFFYTHCRINIS